MLNNSLLQFPRHGSVKIWHLGYLINKGHRAYALSAHVFSLFSVNPSVSSKLSLC